MYKFTNGIVVFDKETRDEYLRAGFTLEKKESKDEVIEGQINIEEAIEEEISENSEDNSIINKKYRPSNKISK